MTRMLTVSAFALALGACSETSSDAPFLPGEWEVTATPIDINVPGANAETIAMLKDMLGEAETQKQCVSEDEAELGFEPLAEAFSQNGDCEVSEFTVGDGAIAGALSCKIAGIAEPAPTSISGTYSENDFDMDIEIATSMPDMPEGRGSMTVSIKGNRIGGC